MLMPGRNRLRLAPVKRLVVLLEDLVGEGFPFRQDLAVPDFYRQALRFYLGDDFDIEIKEGMKSPYVK